MKICFRCGKKFNRDDNFKRHLKNIKKCQVNYLDIEPDEIIKNYEIYEEIYKTECNNENDRIKKIYKCESCNNEFKHKSSFYRHKKNNCEENRKGLEIKILKNKVENLVEDMKNLKENNESNTNNIQNNPHAKIHNNIQNNINIENVNITIQINDYGNETINNISKSEWTEILRFKNAALSRLVKKIHINTEENRNIYLANIKDGNCLVKKNNKWTVKGINNMMEEVVVDNINRIDDYITKNRDSIGDEKYKRIDKMIDDMSDDKPRNREKTKLKRLFINNKELLKNAYKNDIKK